MFKADLDLVKRLHEQYHFKATLLDAGGLERPCIADYDISIAKAIPVTVVDDTGTRIDARIPHSVQKDRYLDITRPWSFIDPDYVILNPDNGGPSIEQMPAIYRARFETIILTSVLEHTRNPYDISDCLFSILRPGGWLFNSTPFLFPVHGDEDNWRFSWQCLRRIHEKSGFQWIEGDFHVNHSTKAGIGDSNPANLGAAQAIIASFALCRKPA